MKEKMKDKTREDERDKRREQKIKIYFHIDFGVHVRSRFHHGGAALLPPSLGGVLGDATFPLSPVGWWCLACSFFVVLFFPLFF